MTHMGDYLLTDRPETLIASVYPAGSKGGKSEVLIVSATVR